MNSTTLLKKSGPELKGIGFVIHIFDFFENLRPISPNLNIIELKKKFLHSCEKNFKLEPRAIYILLCLTFISIK